MLAWSPSSSEALAILAILFAAFFAVLWWRAETRGRRRSRARQARALRGEGRAEALLTNLGFVVLDRQVHTTWTMWVNGTPIEVSCRADLLVEARRVRGVPRGARFVAEVKTGTRAPDPTHPATRRQLLEYLHVLDVDGALVVDMELGTVHRVGF